MKRITNEQREAIVRRAVAERDAITSGAMTILETQVDQFEAEMRKALGWADHHFLRRDGEYALTITQGAWSGWITAVRAAALAAPSQPVAAEGAAKDIVSLSEKYPDYHLLLNAFAAHLSQRPSGVKTS